MIKPTNPTQAMLFCGIDVSAKTLAVAVQQREDQPYQEREFANTSSGHKALLAWLGKWKAPVRVTLEATGTYSLDLAVRLDQAEGVELAVANPKDALRFAQTLRRSKTDAADARTLAEYSRRMRFTAWTAPTRAQLQLRAVARHLDDLTEERTQWLNRLHAAKGSAATPRCVIADIKRSLAALEKRVVALRSEAMELIHADATLERRFQLLVSIPGIAAISALRLLAELGLLTPGMSVRQWVAYSGLDPAHHVSGNSVRRPSRISRAGNRHLRHALFMPALVASKHDPHLKAFYTALIQRHKAKMQALIAVARKMLHAIYGIFKTDTPYNGQTLFPEITAA
jgi:transposase